MKVSVLGLGYVGCITLGCLAECGHQVVGLDVNPLKTYLIEAGKATIIEAKIGEIIKTQQEAGNIRTGKDHVESIQTTDLSIICVGTPEGKNGRPDLEQVMRTATQLGEAIKRKNTFHTVVIRSTVPPGTHQEVRKMVETVSGKGAESFAVVSNPEFLREGSAVEDYYNPPFTLIATENIAAVGIMKELYKEVTDTVTVVDIKVVEMIKYVNNSFHALKVAFTNEVSTICKQMGVAGGEVMDIFKQDKQLNISTAYLEPGFAYGGACLPKDLHALAEMGQQFRVETPVIDSVALSNDCHIKRALKLIMQKGKRNIGILGLSFKPGTDDLRNSPIVEVMDALLQKGYNLLVHDKNVDVSRLLGVNKTYIQDRLPGLPGLIRRDLNDVINHSELVVINHKLPEYTGLEKIYGNKLFIYFTTIEKSTGEENAEGICW